MEAEPTQYKCAFMQHTSGALSSRNLQTVSPHMKTKKTYLSRKSFVKVEQYLVKLTQTKKKKSRFYHKAFRQIKVSQQNKTLTKKLN